MEKKQSIKDRIYDSLFEDIIAGVYPVNAILNERMLVDKYGASKSPVREALVQLCTEGILQNIPRYGYQLTQILPQEIIDIQELRLILELAALERTAPQITGGQLEQLEENVARAKLLVNDRNVLKHWSHNMSFHLLLCSFCGNPFITDSLDRVLKFCSRGAAQYFNRTWEQSKLTDATNHLGLIDRLRQNDLAGARELLAKDVSSMKEEILNT